jgi:hypothetical protein
VWAGQHFHHHHVQRCRDWLRPTPHEVTANSPGPRFPFGALGRGESSRPLRSPRSIPRCVRVFGKQFRHGGAFLFAGSFSLSLGGTSHRNAAARPGRVWVLLGRNLGEPVAVMGNNYCRYRQ